MNGRKFLFLGFLGLFSKEIFCRIFSSRLDVLLTIVLKKHVSIKLKRAVAFFLDGSRLNVMIAER